jgi:hypothetical protein
MGLEIPKHYPVTGHLAVVDDDVCVQEPGEECKTKKVEGSYRGLSQIPRTFANTPEVLWNGGSVPGTHNRRDQEERPDGQHAQGQEREPFQPRQVRPNQPDRGRGAWIQPVSHAILDTGQPGTRLSRS